MNVERTGWRDQSLSERHRSWGAGCTAVDLDLVLVEYHLARPVAIVEYKHHRGTVDLGSPNYRALRDLADRAGLPFIVAFYWPDVWAFRVQPMNEAALQHFAPGGELFTERQFVERLYRLRSAFVHDALLPGLRSVFPSAPLGLEEPSEVHATPVRR
jgi:hypothetical protein